MIPEVLALPPGEALFDMDGTLTENDIAESCLIRVDRLGHRNRVTEGMPSVFSYYKSLPDYAEQCKFAAVALGGLRYGQVEQMVDDAFASGDNAPIHAVVQLAHELSQKHRVWLLTASPEILGEIVGKRLGLQRWFGIKLRQQGDLLLPETYGVISCDLGKVEAAWVMTGRRPVFAIGDSSHDLPLLRHAVIGRTCGKGFGVEFPGFPG